MTETNPNNFDKLLQALLSQENIDPTLIKDVLRIEVDRTSEPTEVQIAKITSQAETNKPWYQWLPWAGFFTLIGGIVTTLITGSFDYATNTESQSHEIQLENLQYEASVFDKLLVIDDLPPVVEGESVSERIERIEDFKEDERRNRICLAASFGIIRVPEYFIVADPSDREAYRDEIKDFLSQYGCTGGEVPNALPLLSQNQVGISTNCPIPTLEIIRNRLNPIDGPTSASFTAETALNLALQELNRGVHEVCNSNHIGDYWSVVGLTFNGADRTPWSAAFISWLLFRSGNPHNLELSGQNMRIWYSGLEKVDAGANGLVLIPSEAEPQIGDLIFIARAHTSVNEIEEIREGRADLLPMQTGIIYSIEDDEITYIGGNIRDMVNHANIYTNDPRIVGYIRQ